MTKGESISENWEKTLENVKEEWANKESMPDDGTQYVPEDSLIFFAKDETEDLPDIEGFIRAAFLGESYDEVFIMVFGEVADHEFEEIINDLPERTRSLIKYYIKREELSSKESLKKAYINLSEAFYNRSKRRM